MRFRSKERPRGILQPRVQQRVTLLIAGVGVLAVLATLTSRPGFLWSSSTGRSVGTGAYPQSTVGLVQSSGELQTGQFPGEIGAPEGTVPLQSVLDKNEVARLDRLSRQTSKDTAAPGISVPAALLQPVQDDVIGIQAKEWDACYACLQLAAKPATQGAGAIPSGHYAVFMDSPEYCRGRLWSIHGTLRRLVRFRSRAESFGTSSLYDAWLSLPDSGSQLVHVIAAELGDGLIVSEDDEQFGQQVHLTGFFFKREGYAKTGADGRGDIGLTPLLVAGRIQLWQPPSVVFDHGTRITPWLGWLAAVVTTCMLGLLWQFQISDSLFRRTRTHQLMSLPVKVPFESVESVTVSETLRQMEEQQSDDKTLSADL